MNYAILRTKKLTSLRSIKGSFEHAFRDKPTPNADASRTAHNAHIGANSSDEAMQKLRARLPKKRRKDAVLAIEYMITASPEAMERLGPEGRRAYFNDSLRWLQQRHGAENVIYTGVHRDEKTQHLYAYVVPLDEATGRLNARKWLGGSTVVSDMQTDFAATVGAKHSLDRGIKGSKAKHQRVQRHYSLVNRAADQVAELSMLDRASLGVGKPTKKALEAVEAGDSYLTLAQQHQAQQKAVRAREQALSKREGELARKEVAINHDEQFLKAAQEEAAELRQKLKQAEAIAQKSQETAELYRRSRDDAIDELRGMRDRGHGLDR